jgi:hypothetical protein
MAGRYSSGVRIDENEQQTNRRSVDLDVLS